MESKYQQIIDPLACSQVIRKSFSENNLSQERLEFLAKLPAFLNIHLDSTKVIRVALEHLQKQIKSDAITLYTHPGETISYWTIYSKDNQRLAGSVTINDKTTVARSVFQRFPCFWFTKEDIGDYEIPAIYSLVEPPEGLICLPLRARQDQSLGALEVLSLKPGALAVEDISFLEQCSHQLSLALANAQLVSELKDTNEQLAQINRRKNEMISVIAHEFLTPLNLIRNSADLLSHATLTIEQIESTDQVLQDGVDRLIKLVAQIKNVSLLQQENLKLKPERIEISTLFKELEAQYSQVCKQRKQLVTFKQDRQNLEIIADRALLAIALQNLIANAIRFTPDSGTIAIQAKEKNNQVEFSIVDTGIGIPASEIPLIFQKFYEVADHLQHSSGDYTFRSGGLGLGLSITQDILKAHNSEIKVQSEEGKGSCFSFLIKV